MRFGGSWHPDTASEEQAANMMTRPIADPGAVTSVPMRIIAVCEDAVVQLLSAHSVGTNFGGWYMAGVCLASCLLAWAWHG